MRPGGYRRAAIAVGLVLGVAGCASLGGSGHPTDPPVTLEVVSHNDAAFDLYALAADGRPQRVGMVMSFGKESIPLSRDLTARGTVRVLAVPIGGFGAASSGSLVVRDGDTIVFTLEQVLTWSQAVVQSPST